MKKLIALTALSALFLSACSTGGEDLQGRFTTPTVTVITMGLSSSSPSGSRSVSSSDSFMAFEASFNKKITLPAGTEFRVDLRVDGSDGDATKGKLDAAVSGETITLKEGGSTVGTGTFAIIDLANPYEGTAYITTTKAITFSKGATLTFTLSGNTSSLIAEEAGADDVMTAIVEYNGQTVTGNALNY